MSEDTKNKLRGTNRYNWTGDNCSYESLHIWLKTNYRKPDHCEKCDGKNAKRFEWANISGEYKRDIKDFMQLCPSCHRLMDRGNFCRQGHEFTEINTWIRVRKNGNSYRVCKQCQKNYQLKYNSKNEN